MFYVYFNNLIDRDLGIKAVKRPSIPTPKRKYETKTIKGQDGDLYIDTGAYEDITISIEYNFHDLDNFNEKCRQIKRWINKIQENKLKFSDDLEVFYRVKKVEIKDNIERTYKVLGKFTLEFVCEPYTYYCNGEDSIALYSGITLENNYEIAKPTYIIKGEGNITLNINGNPVVINVGQEVVIDTKYEECFKNDQMIKLALTTGTYKNLYLSEGINTITYSVGSGGNLTSIEIIPYWRTI